LIRGKKEVHEEMTGPSCLYKIVASRLKACCMSSRITLQLDVCQSSPKIIKKIQEKEAASRGAPSVCAGTPFTLAHFHTGLSKWQVCAAYHQPMLNTNAHPNEQVHFNPTCIKIYGHQSHALVIPPYGLALTFLETIDLPNI
jgi:hypothetical protein